MVITFTLLLGMGKSLFNQANHPAACSCFKRIIADYPKNGLAPEAIYMDGITSFIQGHDVSHLIAIYDRLAADYPDSPWLTRADPYRLLKQSS